MLWVVAPRNGLLTGWCRANGWPLPDRGIRLLLLREHNILGIHFQPGDLVIELGMVAPEDDETWAAWHIYMREKRLSPSSVGFRRDLTPWEARRRDFPVSCAAPGGSWQ